MIGSKTKRAGDDARGESPSCEHEKWKRNVKAMQNDGHSTLAGVTRLSDALLSLPLTHAHPSWFIRHPRLGARTFQHFAPTIAFRQCLLR